MYKNNRIVAIISMSTSAWRHISPISNDIKREKCAFAYKKGRNFIEILELIHDWTIYKCHLTSCTFTMTHFMSTSNSKNIKVIISGKKCIMW